MIKKSYPIFHKLAYKTWNPIRIIKQFCYDIKCCYQRVRYGWCEKDTWSIDVWFLNVVPYMLEFLKENQHGHPAMFDENGNVDPNAEEKWNDILTEMIRLFRDADEENCSFKNQYEDEWERIHEEFNEKYGFFGEKLKTSEGNFTRCYTPGDIPEYKETMDKWFEEEKRISEYRDRCKDTAFEMFSEWFWSLWD